MYRAIRKLQISGAVIALINVALRLAKPKGEFFFVELAVHSLGLVLAMFMYPLLARFRRAVGWVCLLSGGLGLILGVAGVHHMFFYLLALVPGLILLFDKDVQQFDWREYLRPRSTEEVSDEKPGKSS
jgi:hypothetical protein